MGFSSSQCLHLFFIIITISLFFLSLQRSHILVPDSKEKLNLMEDGNHKQIEKVEKVSGEDENEEKEALIVQKFRVLLGLKRLRRGIFPQSEILSPSPSPSITIGTEALSPAPAAARPPVSLLQIHRHPHSAFHDSSEALKKQRDRGRFRRVLAAVLVSTGAAFIAFVLGLIWVSGKFRKNKRISARTMSVYSKKGRTRGKSKYASPGIDLLYGLEKDLEKHSTCLKQTHEVLDAPLKEPELDNASSCSSTREIMSVHGDGESVQHDFDGGNCLEAKSVTVEEQDQDHSSDDDDESFHSFVESNFRLSNASTGSVGDTLEIAPANLDFQQTVGGQKLQTKAPPPPPPPPPTPPPSTLLPPLHFSPSRASSSSFTKGPPPPPCPPPFLKANSRSPPPPPSALSQNSPVGKDGAPLPKLKPLHWDKVRAAPDRSMVWDKIRSSSFEFDEEMMESLFGYNLQTTMKNDEAKSKSPSPSKHVLEPKRLQNLTILSKALNASPEQVCEALTRGEGLNSQQLEALAKMVPTKEEEAKLGDYRGNVNELVLAEKFVKLALTVPFAFVRVEAMLYRETFEDEVVHLRNSFSMLEEACKELRSSRLFLKLLEAVLKTGNRMNVGTIRGGARAFKLDALLKLSDVKGTDGKTTLLHFVVQEMIRSEGVRVSDSIMGRINQKNKTKTTEQEWEEEYRRMGLDLVSGLTTELYNVKKTATVDLDVLASSVSNLSDGMAKLQNLMFKELPADEKSESFVDSMRGFVKYAERSLKELQEDENKVLLHVREISEYFHGNVSKEEANPLRIFVIVRDFLGMLDHVCKELRNLKVPSSPNPLTPFR